MADQRAAQPLKFFKPSGLCVTRHPFCYLFLCLCRFTVRQHELNHKKTATMSTIQLCSNLSIIICSTLEPVYKWSVNAIQASILFNSAGQRQLLYQGHLCSLYTSISQFFYVKCIFSSRITFRKQMIKTCDTQSVSLAWVLTQSYSTRVEKWMKEITVTLYPSLKFWQCHNVCLSPEHYLCSLPKLAE